MRLRSRLIFIVTALVLLVTIGRLVTGSFDFFLTQFWFASGLFLLLLISLIDQPHFSTDANIFLNAITGWTSLLLVTTEARDILWWGFLIWSAYLMLSSLVLMWVRSRDLPSERPIIRTVSRLNREIGRPEALFSAFFLWGCVQQFGNGSPKLGALFLFWAIFMILDLPALAGTIDGLLGGNRTDNKQSAGILARIISPNVAEAFLDASLPVDLVGSLVNINSSQGKLAGHAVVVDDRIVAGKRVARLAIRSVEDAWRQIGTPAGGSAIIELVPGMCETDGSCPLSVVDVGSDIGKLVFHVHPSQRLQAGEVLWVYKDSAIRTYYQVISAVVCQASLHDGNDMLTVRVTAGQLGNWDSAECRFEPIAWVAPAGQLVYKLAASAPGYTLPDGHECVGHIPISEFPVHVDIKDAVTHNTAIIGVTGSGKSYLAFHLIEAMARNKVKVMVLDISRQHDVHLGHLNPTPLISASDVKGWIAGDTPIGIHQFAGASNGFPKNTADFVDAAFSELSQAKLERGKNIPAKLCIVFEEAHSLIPEWNQVASQTDQSHVNRTARTMLQGRKYGMGALIITQRTANVTKTILNQCNTIFALQCFDQTGLDFLRNYMGEEYSQAISTLPVRHAILVGKASSSSRPVIVSVSDFSNRWKGD